jgi:hypothetical protein
MDWYSDSGDEYVGAEESQEEENGDDDFELGNVVSQKPEALSLHAAPAGPDVGQQQQLLQQVLARQSNAVMLLMNPDARDASRRGLDSSPLGHCYCARNRRGGPASSVLVVLSVC